MKTRVLLVGGFNKTRSLANSLINKGYHVTAINSDKEKCRILAGIDKLTVFNGDGTMPAVLEDANAQNADIVIALTDRDEDNLVICELCKKRFRVKRTAAVISDPRKTEFFYRMGVDSVVCAITTVASVIEQQAFLEEISSLPTIGEGRIRIVQVPISSDAPVVGKTMMEIRLPGQAIIGCILRGENSTIPRGDTRVLSGDVLVLISSEEHEAAAIETLVGR